MTKWTHYLTRPFSLLGASIWHRWYDSKQIEAVLGLRLPNGMLIQEPAGTVRHYLDEAEFTALKNAVRNLVEQEYERITSLLKEGEEMNARAVAAIAQGPSAFATFEEAVDFLVDLALRATILPYWTYNFMEELGLGTEEDKKRAETLRGISHYHDFMVSVVEPMAAGRLTCSASGAPESGKLFVLIYTSEGEQISWHNDTAEKIAEIEGAVDVDVQTLMGRPAFPGVVRGTARIIVRPEAGQVFEMGDILVTTNSNPAFMSYILKSGAIVTDEGGITCHAAIVSRELEKPCVIGTKNATKVLKDGDEVEVDAMTGAVRVISRV